jgi:hypothetical protein
MSYIGQIPATTFLQKQSQSFTPDGSTTSFSLDFAVTNEKDLLVVVNNVIQEPGDGKAYTASANTLLMSAAPASGDTMYCYYLGFTVGTINTPDSSVTKAKTNFITDTSTAGVTSKGSGSQAGQIQLNCSANSHGIKIESPPHSAAQSYTLVYPDNDVTAGNVMQVDSISGSGATATGSLKFKNVNAPAFSAYLSSDQTLTDNTFTKIQFNTEVFDDDGTYDNSTNYRFTPGVAGKYLITTQARIIGGSDNQLRKVLLQIQKNGSERQTFIINTQDSYALHTCSGINVLTDTATATDYYEVFCKADVGSGTVSAEGDLFGTWFAGHKLNV